MSGGPAKAFLLAAGVGSRLRPLTDKTPKCLLPVAGEPCLHWWLTALEREGVREVLINTHHHAEQVEAFVASRRYALKTTLVHEPELLGSGGTLAANAAFAAGEAAFWVCYADTLIGGSFAPLWELHRARRPSLTLGLFRTPEPQSCGIVELSGDGTVLSFEEKPKEPKTDLAAGGVTLAGPELLEVARSLAGRRPLDLGGHCFPPLMKKACGKLLEGPVLDIGTPERYALAQKAWAAYLGKP